jgi:hypothetical protein
MLATGLLMSGAGAGIAFADTGDTAGTAPEPVAVTSNAGDNSTSGATGADNPDPPTATVGNGREDVGVQSTAEVKKDDSLPRATTTKKYKGSVTIPIPRIPTRAELPASGLPSPDLFYTVVVVPIPTLGEVLAAMQPQPEPAPAPGPAFRTQEEAPPVVDSGGAAAGGGGVDPLSVGVAAEPPVLRAPMVIAPLPIPLPPALPPVAPIGGVAGAGPAPVVAADVAAAGARAPLIRGSLQPTVKPRSSSLTPMSGQATRLGYPRSLRNPTTAELAVLALPGTAGLLALTFSGGIIGYRQANSTRFIRTQSAARFLR